MKNKYLPRIALDVSQMVYGGHGVGRYTEELARALLSCSDFKFTFYAGVLRQLPFFLLRRRIKPWSRANWRLLPLPPRVAELVWNHTPLPFEFVSGSQDLIHTSDWTAPLTRCPSVTTIHDLVFHHYPQTVHPNIRRVQTTRLSRAIRAGTHFIADSKNTKTDLMKIYSLPSSRITVIYPGISSQFTQVTKNQITQVKNIYKLPDRYLLTLATREPRKNLSRLIQAWSTLKSTFPTIPPLVIAGRYGWGQETPPPTGVLVTGYINDSDLPALYSGAKLLVYPSLYEGFGFPVLEAMACGTPVVTSNTSSLPEVAGDAAILINPQDPIAIAAGIKQALAHTQTLREKGLRQAKRFSWDRTARATLAVYQKILTART